VPIDVELRILDYDPDWPRQAAAAIDALQAAAPGLFTVIEHIGSTAAPGLAAKPSRLYAQGPPHPVRTGCGGLRWRSRVSRRRGR
jgi:hypothetical protein